MERAMEMALTDAFGRHLVFGANSNEFKRILLLHSEEKKNFEEASKEWVAGGGRFPTTMTPAAVESYTDEPYYYSNFADKFGMPALESHCICGHPIVHNCFLYNTLNGNVLVVGNHCIHRYIPCAATKTCAICFAPHKRRTCKYCVDCEREMKNEEKAKKAVLNATLRFGMYRGQTIGDVVESSYKGRKWLKWCCDEEIFDTRMPKLDVTVLRGILSDYNNNGDV